MGANIQPEVVYLMPLIIPLKQCAAVTMMLRPMTVAVQLNLAPRTWTKNLPTVLYPLTAMAEDAAVGSFCAWVALETGVEAAAARPVALAAPVGEAALLHAVSIAARSAAASSFTSVQSLAAAARSDTLGEEEPDNETYPTAQSRPMAIAA